MEQHTSIGPVAQAVADFILDRQAGYHSPDTIAFYRTQLRPFARHRDAQALPLATLSRGDIIAYLNQRRAEGRSPASIRAEFAAMHAFLTWAIQHGRAPEDCLDRVRWPKLPKVAIKPFSRSDVEKLLAEAARGSMPERDQAMLLLMADTGLRASELLGLKDTDIRGGRILIRGKGSRERWVPVSPEALAAIDRWRAVRPPEATHLFWSRHHRPLHRASLCALFKRLGERAGIDGVRCSPHTMRHTTGVEWIRDNGDVFTLQRLLGHADLNMTRRYLLLNDQDVADAHQRHSLAAKLVRSPGG